MSTLIMLNKLIDAADQTIFPCVYMQIGQEFEITPTTLGSITLLQILARSLTCPLWGILADRYSKRKLLSIGCFIWGVTSILFALSTNVFFLFVFRMLNGIGLGSVSPIMQALVSEQSKSSTVGYSFGLLSIAAMIGSSFGTLIGTSLPWRLAFWVVGILSIVLAVADWYQIKDTKSFNTNFTISQLVSEIRQVFSSPSILIIMFQGVIGTIPWVAMSYLTLFFQQIGFTATQVTLMTFLFTISSGVGGFVGGIIGDKIHQIVPYRGRVYAAQFSVFSGIPMVYIIFGMIKPSGDKVFVYTLSLIVLGLTCSWCSTGCNRPLFIDIVPRELRATAIAWVVAVDDSLSGIAAPLVGSMAEMYGYGLDKSDAVNAEALRKALLQSMTWPWVICLATYSFLYWTYEKEVEAVRRQYHRLG